eukprot:GILK01001640.1.p1 GENE.GILK01001640.1~~GILK01001640.1.p1  ORF type:complete len:415 (-),score=103.99 GILK01001640.1:181-1323(-)
MAPVETVETVEIPVVEVPSPLVETADEEVPVAPVHVSAHNDIDDLVNSPLDTSTAVNVSTASTLPEEAKVAAPEPTAIQAPAVKPSGLTGAVPPSSTSLSLPAAEAYRVLVDSLRQELAASELRRREEYAQIMGLLRTSLERTKVLEDRLDFIVNRIDRVSHAAPAPAAAAAHNTRVIQVDQSKSVVSAPVRVAHPVEVPVVDAATQRRAAEEQALRERETEKRWAEHLQQLEKQEQDRKRALEELDRQKRQREEEQRLLQEEARRKQEEEAKRREEERRRQEEERKKREEEDAKKRQEFERKKKQLFNVLLDGGKTSSPFDDTESTPGVPSSPGKVRAEGLFRDSTPSAEGEEDELFAPKAASNRLNKQNKSSSNKLFD